MSDINKLAKSSKSISEFADKYILHLKNIFQSIDKSQLEKLVNEFENARKNGNTIFLIGNGGSATTATSMANDLGFDIIKKTKTNTPLRCMALTDSNSVITAISNDLDYSEVFINQLKIHFRKGDKLVAISASGNSENLINAVKWVKKNKGKIISFLGFDGGKLLKLSDISIHIKSSKGDYGPVEDSHLIINHILAHWFQTHIKS
jgi:D-sedoheptulose 7-phosphate isomerase